jgi:hypothetical protein
METLEVIAGILAITVVGALAWAFIVEILLVILKFRD